MRGGRAAQSAPPSSRIEAISRYTIGAAAANFALLAYLTRLYTDSPAWLDVVGVAHPVDGDGDPPGAHPASTSALLTRGGRTTPLW